MTDTPDCCRWDGAVDRRDGKAVARARLPSGKLKLVSVARYDWLLLHGPSFARLYPELADWAREDMPFFPDFGAYYLRRVCNTTACPNPHHHVLANPWKIAHMLRMAPNLKAAQRPGTFRFSPLDKMYCKPDDVRAWAENMDWPPLFCLAVYARDAIEMLEEDRQQANQGRATA